MQYEYGYVKNDLDNLINYISKPHTKHNRLMKHEIMWWHKLTMRIICTPWSRQIIMSASHHLQKLSLNMTAIIESISQLVKQALLTMQQKALNHKDGWMDGLVVRA